MIIGDELYLIIFIYGGTDCIRYSVYWFDG